MLEKLKEVKTWKLMTPNELEVAQNQFAVILSSVAGYKKEEAEEFLSNAINIWNNKPKPDSAGVPLINLNLKGLSLREKNIPHCFLKYSNLDGADLTRNNMRGSVIQSTSLNSTDFTEANMSNVTFANDATLLEQFPDIITLSGTKMESADLAESCSDCYMTFDDVNLEYANFTRANLMRKTSFQNCNLRYANFLGARITELQIPENTDIEGAIVIGIDEEQIKNAKNYGKAIKTPEQLLAKIQSILDLNKDELTEEHIKMMPNLYKAAATITGIKTYRGFQAQQNEELKQAAENLEDKYPYFCRLHHERNELKENIQNILKPNLWDNEKRDNISLYNASLQILGKTPNIPEDEFISELQSKFSYKPNALSNKILHNLFSIFNSDKPLSVDTIISKILKTEEALHILDRINKDKLLAEQTAPLTLHSPHDEMEIDEDQSGREPSPELSGSSSSGAKRDRGDMSAGQPDKRARTFL